jgi:hypothetical protein
MQLYAAPLLGTYTRGEINNYHITYPYNILLRCFAQESADVCRCSAKTAIHKNAVQNEIIYTSVCIWSQGGGPHSKATHFPRSRLGSSFSCCAPAATKNPKVNAAERNAA